MYKIILTLEHYEKGTRKTWGKPVTTKTEEIDRNYYENYVTATPFFNRLGFARNYYNYTCQGYIVTKCITISPNGREKAVANFKFIGL